MRLRQSHRASSVLRGLTLVRSAAAKLLAVLLLAGCSFGPPVYEGKIDSAVLLGDGRIALGYSQLVWRNPEGLAAFPDGGRAQIIHNQVLVALVDSDGRTREIARYNNAALLGKGHIRIDWFEADPLHLYGTLSGQLTSLLPARRLGDTVRINLNGQELARFDLSRELAAQGRNFGAKGVGTRVVDADGTMLVGATHDKVRELWRRDPNGKWTLLDSFDTNVEIIDSDFVYKRGNYLFAQNWMTGEARELLYFNPSTQQSEILMPGDKALLRNNEYRPKRWVQFRSTSADIQIMRDNVPIASIKPDDQVLDRR